MPRSTVVRRPRDRLRFHHNAAYIMTAFFCAALTIASLGSHFHRTYIGPQENSQSRNVRRFLADQQQQNDDNNNDNNGHGLDYSSYSCVDMMELYPEPGAEQCAFSKTCNRHQGVFMSWIFCTKWSYTTWCAILSPFLLIWMVILFRMLGSTAEDYFSPSLEMFSFKLRLPPRFAGVSLLALGNGAADVSSTVNAITSDPRKGYLLSLGALTGSAMFIGSVVAGVIMLVADGVPCRGALVRDVFVLWLTAVIVLSKVASGHIGSSAVSLFSSLYLTFVVIVLVADVYHRAVVLPRLQQEQEATEVARQLNEEQRANELIANNLNEAAATQAEESAQQETPRTPPPSSSGTGIFGRVVTALSNYDNKSALNNNKNGQDGWGVESSELLEGDQPVVLHGPNGMLSHHHHHSRTPQPSGRTDAVGEGSPGPSTPYSVLEDGGTMDQMCVEPGTGSYSAINWRGAWNDAIQEVKTHLMDSWKEMIQDDEDDEEDEPTPTMWWDRGFNILEFPFTVLRKLSVPIPCEGYYCRGVVAASVTLSPLWLGYYLWSGDYVNLFSRELFGVLLVMVAVSCTVGAIILRYSPGGEGVMTMLFATPIALYGFIIAATWIDFVADHLVDLLQFIGVVCRIPGSIMGLTILAWGNSMGDLSADVTMARKGLANMAMTACFAGPVFNILIGLGLGFSSLLGSEGIHQVDVTMNAAILTGFLAIIVNTTLMIVMGPWLFKGRFPRTFGYALLFLYMIYVVTSVLLQFSRNSNKDG